MSKSINRRTFARAAAGGILGFGLSGTLVPAQSPAQPKPAARRNTQLRMGADYHVVKAGKDSPGDWTSKENFNYHMRFEVRHFTNSMSGNWDFDRMRQWKDNCDKAQMIWEMIRMDSSYIYLAPGDERNRKLDEITGNIRKASQVGVQVISMHWTLIPIRRNTKTPGHGGTVYTGFKLEDNWQNLPVEEHGKVSYDEYWERIEYFLSHIIPVCKEYDVRLAVHPYDPPGLPRGYQGVDNWDAEPATVFESLNRYMNIIDSPYNGLQLCLGTVMEGLKDPKNELLPIVRYFAERGKIYQIHMRNIRGGLHHFEEVHIHEGEANFLEVMRLLRDTGYSRSILPDHVPSNPGDTGGYEGFAHAFGYIQSLINTANTETP